MNRRSFFKRAAPVCAGLAGAAVLGVAVQPEEPNYEFAQTGGDLYVFAMNGTYMSQTTPAWTISGPIGTSTGIVTTAPRQHVPLG